MKHIGLLLFVLSGGLLAQTTGELHGTITDPSQHPVSGAKVSAKLDNTSAVRNTVTDDKGEFSFTSVAVGQYTVEVNADGFRTHVQSYVQVTLGHVIDVSAQLEAGDSTVLLAEDTPLVERTSTQLGAVVNSHAVVMLPLNERNTYELLQLQPGVQSQEGYDLFAGADNAGVVSVNGGRGRANNFNVNGADANDLFIGIPAIQPSPDAIEEFRVLTNLFDAEYGRNSGSIVNVVTKNGTNDLHGSAYEFLRNRALNTRGFFDTEKPQFNQNQFGGTAGGAIRKDRTFFFLSSEGRQIRQGISSDLVTVPSAAERAGDFSAGPAFTGTLQDAFLVQTLNQRPGCATAVAAEGGAPIAANTPWNVIFPGNRIPVPCFDQTALDLMNQFVPPANIGASTFQTAPVQSDRAIQTTMRIDHTLNAQHQLSFYYYFDDDATRQPFSNFEATGANLPGFGADFSARNQQVNLGETWSVNATTVNEARLSYLREGMANYNHPSRTGLVQSSCATVPAAECFSDPANPRAGITPGLTADNEGVPFIQLSGAFSIGNNQAGELPQVGNTFQAVDNLSKIVRNHHLKFGVDARRQRFDQTLYYNVDGTFGFTSGGPNDVGAGNQFPNYLLGLPTSYSQGSSQSENLRSTALYAFAEDSWSVSKSLTLNYGLRWELNTPMRDVGQRLQVFRPGEATQVFPCQLDASNPLVQAFGTNACGPGSAGEAVLPLGLVVPGDAGVPPTLVPGYYGAFAPRIGLAWSPASPSGWLNTILGGPGKTSVRMGWGLFYNPMEQLVLEQFSGEPPFGGTLANSNTLFNTPFLGQDGTVYNNPFNGVLNPVRGQPVDWSAFEPISLFGNFPAKLHPQYSINYNFTIQRELRKDLLLQAGFVGSQGHHLLATYDANYGEAQPCLDLNALSNITGNASLACGPFSADSSYTIPANTIPAGFTLHLPYGPVATVTGPNANPITLVGLRRYSSPSCNPLTGGGCPPDGIPVFGSIFTEDTIANSNYNSLQVSVEKRTLVGLQFLAAYTLGKSIDNASSFENLLNPLDYGSSRSLSFFDARQRLVFSSYWDLPHLNLNGMAGRLLNGWAASGILSLQSGFPIPITSSDDLELMNSDFFTYPGEPNMVAPLQKLDPRNPLHLAFDPSSFEQPAMGLIGNSPRAVCCGPGIDNLDMSIMKTVSIKERYTFQFRAEAFNVANHAQFSKVDGNISDATFGQVLLARDPRLMQFALKIGF
jgi:hypothetical protein